MWNICEIFQYSKFIVLRYLRHLRHEYIALYSVASDLLLSYITSPTSLTWDISNIVVVRYVFAHNFLNIQRIFNPEKVLESWETGLSNNVIKCCVYESMSEMSEIYQVNLWAVILCMSEMSEIVIIFNIHRIWCYGWKALSLSFPKLFLDWKSVEY